MANEYLHRTPTSIGNRTTWTFSCWVKTTQTVPHDYWDWLWNTDTNGGLVINYDTPNYIGQLFWYDNAGSQTVWWEPAFRDINAWYHICLTVDTKRNYDSERVKAWVNGVQLVESDDLSTTWPAVNVKTSTNNDIKHSIGRWEQGNARPGLFYLSDLYHIDGQYLEADAFGYYKDGYGSFNRGTLQSTNFHPGIWVPKSPRLVRKEVNRKGGFGTNGFYLPMNCSSNPGMDMKQDEPDTILKLKTNLAQPKCEVDGDPKEAVREDPLKDYLILAVPGQRNGLSNGYGDYSHLIKGYGAPVTITQTTSNAAAVVTTTSHAPYGDVDNNGTSEGSSMNFDSNAGHFKVGNTGDFDFGSDDFTIEFWKRSHSHATAAYFAKYDSSAGNTGRTFWFGEDSDGHPSFYYYSGNTDTYVGGNFGAPQTTGQWQHLCAERHRNEIALYVNGTCVSRKAFTGSLNTLPTLETWIGGNYKSSSGDNYYYNGRIKDLRVYRGVAKYKGAFDTPKPYIVSGWDVWRVTSDTPRNSYATLNKLIHDSRTTTGNLKSPGDESGNGWHAEAATFPCMSGKWYWEYACDDLGQAGSYWHGVGVQFMNYKSGIRETNENYLGNQGDDAVGAILKNNALDKFKNGSNVGSLVSGSYDGKNIIHAAVDIEAGHFYAGVNGVWYGYGSGQSAPGNPVEDFGAGNPVIPMITTYETGDTDYNGYLNFGQNPTFNGQYAGVNAGRETDDNGQGLFKYKPPSGFLAMCTANLEATIKNPMSYFNSVLWDGEESSNTGPHRCIKKLGFKPDLMIMYPRSNGDNRIVCDSLRGPISYLELNDTHNETLDQLSNYGRFMSFDEDGFSLGPWNNLNNSGWTYCGHGWKAGGNNDILNYNGKGYSTTDEFETGTGVDLTSGTITPSRVSIGTTQGFSMLYYTGNATAGATIAHGLPEKPTFIMCKNITGGQELNWIVWFRDIGTKYLEPNTTAATQAQSSYNMFNSTAPDSKHVTLGSIANTNKSGEEHVLYCWHDVPGFSYWGSYKGNGNADGPFIYCGFRPAMVWIKRTDSADDWTLYDNMRDAGKNPSDNIMYINTTDSENVDDTSHMIDMLSNGFKMRGTSGQENANNGIYVFFAFAEQSMKYANAK